MNWEWFWGVSAAVCGALALGLYYFSPQPKAEHGLDAMRAEGIRWWVPIMHLTIFTISLIGYLVSMYGLMIVRGPKPPPSLW